MKKKQETQQFSSLMHDRNRGLMSFKEKYINWYKAQGVSENYVKRHHYHLNYFLHWCNQRDVSYITQIDKDTLLHFRKSVSEKKNKKGQDLSDTTRRDYFVTTANFFCWLNQKNYLLVNPAEHIPLLPKPKTIPKQILSASEVEQMLGEIDLTTPAGIRDRAMMELFYSTGIRRGELVKLKLENIDFSRSTILVELTKNKRDRLIPLGQRAAKWLDKYLQQVRSCVVKDPEQSTFFLNQYGTPFSPPTISKIMKVHVKKIGKSGSCHIFRHTMASLMLENGASVRHIQKILGHVEINCTQIYTKVSIGKLKLVYQYSHPANREEQDQIPQNNPKELDVIDKKARPGKQRTIEYLPDPSPKEDSTTTLFNKYLYWLKLTNFSITVQEQRRHHIKTLILWCNDRDIHSITEITEQNIESYQRFVYRITNKNGQKLMKSSIQRYLISLAAFFKWLAQENYILHNPAKNMKIPSVCKRLPKHILTHQEVEKILSQPRLDVLLELRDRAILEVLYSTGIRRAELVNLNIDDINFENQTLFIHQGKGRKDRLIPIGERALNWLEKYLEQVRPSYLADEQEKALFLSRRYCRIGKQTLRSIKKYFKAAGIDKNPGCHIFRHTMGAPS